MGDEHIGDVWKEQFFVVYGFYRSRSFHLERSATALLMSALKCSAFAAQLNEPVKITQRVADKKLLRFPKGERIIDFGQYLTHVLIWQKSRSFISKFVL